MSLLDSVNRLLRKLRDDSELTTLVGAEDRTNPLVDLLNEAAADLFNHRVWSFLKRYDGQVFMPAPFVATTGGSIQNGFTQGALNPIGSNPWASADVFDFTGLAGTMARTRARVIWANEERSYGVTELSVGVGFQYTQAHVYRGTDHILEGWTLYTHEHVLPDTVRQVLAVRHEDREIVLQFLDRDFDAVPAFPRADVHFGEPEWVAVGGTLTATSNDSGLLTGTATGLGFTVWPVPDRDTFLNYSYVYRYPELAADTDAWTGVPIEHERLIESIAFQKALSSNIEDDPRRAAQVKAENEITLARLVAADQRMVNQRRVTPEIGRNPDGRFLPRYQVVLS